MIIKKRSLLLLLSIFAVIVPLVFSGCTGSGQQTITEAGSTTVQPLAEKCAQAFMSENPNVSITIQGGGSSVGVKSADDGTVDASLADGII